MIDRYLRELDTDLNANLDFYEYQLARYLNDLSVDLRSPQDTNWNWNMGFGYPEDGDMEQPAYDNVIKSAIDTLVSKLANQKVRPYFTPVNGLWSTKKVVRQVQQYFDILYDEKNVNWLVKQAFRSACIFGKGHVFVNPFTGELQYLPAFCVQTLTSEARYSSTPTKVLIRFLNFPSHLISQFVGEDVHIDDTHRLVNLRLYINTQSHEMIVYANDKELLKTQYKADIIPVCTIYFTDPVFGNKTTSVVRELDGIQSQINYINEQISASMQSNPTNIYFVAGESSMNAKDLSDKAGMVYTVKTAPGSTQPPVTQVTPRIADPQWESLLRYNIQRASERIGLSELSQMSKKPAGLDSGAALQTMEDIESDRFETQVNAYVRMFVDIANVIIQVMDKSKDILPDSINTSSLKWRDIEKQRDLFKVQYSAATSLSKDPAEKRKEVLQMSQVGLITPDKIAKYLDQPDLEDAYREASAVADGVYQCIERAIENEEYDVPDWVDYQLLAKQITVTENELYSSINDDTKGDAQVMQALQRLRQLEERLFITMQESGFVQSEEQQEAIQSEEGIGVASSAVDVKDISNELDTTSSQAEPESVANEQVATSPTAT